MTARDDWPVRVKPFHEAPDGKWRAVSFDPPDGMVATYGNVSIQCPACEYDWEENAQRVEREVGRALGKPTHIINPGTPDAREISRDGHGRVPLGERPEWRLRDANATILGQVLEAARNVVNDHDGRCGCCTDGPHCPNCRLGFLLRKLDKA